MITARNAVEFGLTGASLIKSSTALRVRVVVAQIRRALIKGGGIMAGRNLPALRLATNKSRRARLTAKSLVDILMTTVIAPTKSAAIAF